MANLRLEIGVFLIVALAGSCISASYVSVVLRISDCSYLCND